MIGYYLKKRSGKYLSYNGKSKKAIHTYTRRYKDPVIFQNIQKAFEVFSSGFFGNTALLFSTENDTPLMNLRLKNANNSL